MKFAIEYVSISDSTSLKKKSDFNIKRGKLEKKISCGVSWILMADFS